MPMINGKKCDGHCFICYYRMHCNRHSSKFEYSNVKSNKKFSHRNPRKRLFPKIEGNSNVRILGQDFKHEKRVKKDA